MMISKNVVEIGTIYRYIDVVGECVTVIRVGFKVSLFDVKGECLRVTKIVFKAVSLFDVKGERVRVTEVVFQVSFISVVGELVIKVVLRHVQFVNTVIWCFGC